MFLCSFHFLLKTQQQPIASLPSSKSSILQVSIFFSISISADIAAFLYSFSSFYIASSKLFGSRSSFFGFVSASYDFSDIALIKFLKANNAQCLGEFFAVDVTVAHVISGGVCCSCLAVLLGYLNICKTVIDFLPCLMN